ncbi:MAG: SusC/RagA family TonB-linked outer membrane protein [Bacteroidales bacterium]|nr:SusC/RagA family TonB-linked outer membrane protein [Bacteroidales bacterium]
MRHIHNSLIICAALATVPFATEVKAEVASTVASAAFESNAPLADSPMEDILVKGRVVDEEGNPLPGVTVAVSGTTRGTISDVNGNFEINAPEDAVLSFSFRGFYPMQVDVSGREELGDIVLTKDLNAGLIDLPYRKVNENDLIGSVSYVNVVDKMETNYTTATFDNMETYVGGWNGSTLWGMSNENSSYFVVIDGCPRGLTGHENLIPTEIESITFLKGADAVALYGSRGAKGAILITTKRGKVRDGLEINSRVVTGFHVAKRFPQYLSSAEYMSLYNEARKSDGEQPLYTDEDIYNYGSHKNIYRYPDIDYYSDEYVSKMYNHTDANLELVGGSQRAQYYGSINYWTEGDYLKVGDSEDNRTHRYSVRGNVDVKVADFIKAYINANATFYDVKTASNANWWESAATRRPSGNRTGISAPMIPVSMVDPNNQSVLDLLSTTSNIYDGKFLAGTSQEKTSVFGDMYVIGERKFTIRKFQFDAGLDFDLSSLLPGLSLKTVMGMDFSTQYVTAFNNGYGVFVPTWGSYNGKEYIVDLVMEGEDSHTGSQNVSDSRVDRMISVAAYFDYARSFGKHNVHAMWLASGSQQTTVGTYHSDCGAHMGFFAGYNYDHKYFLDFSSAIVHSVRLAEGHRNAFSPSVTVAWDLAKESFLNGSFVDKLQLEGSASIINEDYDVVYDNTKYYLYNGAWGTNAYSFTYGDGKNATGVSPTRGNNDELRMVQRKEVRGGLRTSFLNGMFTLTGNYFANDMDGYLILNGSDLPDHMTHFLAVRNNNIVHRTGFDFEFTFNKKFGEVDLSLGFNGTHYTSERTKYDETPKYDYLAREGREEDAVWGYKCLGIFQSQEEIDNAPVQNLGSKPRPGDLRYADLNGDNKIDADDQKCLGVNGTYGAPTSLGFNLVAKWRDFSFFVAGRSIMGATKFKNGSSYYKMEQESKYSVIARNSWREDNPGAKYPRISSKTNANNYVQSDFWSFKQDVFYLDKIQISYQLPARLFAGSFVKGVSVFALGSGLLTVSSESEWLELNIGGKPQSRYYGLGVQAKF